MWDVRQGAALVLFLHSCFAVVLERDRRDDRKLWSGVACSLDGSKIVAVVGGYNGAGGYIYMSSDAGLTWHAGNSEVHSWRAVASSADGSKLVAVEDSSLERKGGFVHTSTDSGVTWNVRQNAGCRNWNSVASSTDGNNLVAVVGGYVGESGNIYTSSDAGETWSARMTDAVHSWRDVSSSDDGMNMHTCVDMNLFIAQRNRQLCVHCVLVASMNSM